MLKRLLTKWNSYRYRFVPWIALTFRKRTVRSVADQDCDHIIPSHEVDSSLRSLCEAFEEVDVSGGSAWQVPHDRSAQHAVFLDVMKRSYGFTIERRASVLDGGGLGVVVTKGLVPKGSLVALYPGTVYQPYDPILMQSIKNQFIFRCIDGVYIDGKNEGISKYIYRSCAQRDRHGPYFTCDSSWLTEFTANPLNVGQYVNNQSKKYAANVSYQEFDLPPTFPFHLMKYIPNIHYSSSIVECTNNRRLRLVALISTRDIHMGEELFSTYFTVVH